MTDEAWNSLQEGWHRKNLNKLYLKLKKGEPLDFTETEFNAPKYKCENYQTGMNEFEYTFSCPECHDRCYSHQEVK